MMYNENEYMLSIYIDNKQPSYKDDLWKKFSIIYDDLSPRPIMIQYTDDDTYINIGYIDKLDPARIFFYKTKPENMIKISHVPALIKSFYTAIERSD